ncbi:MAG: HAMP domain-containing sensor histidine kinase, partial [Leptolyngbyaceae bacterium]|nr:HAMP domain-containing sensor histidine kinase [Leptolyngbyaceae bacterium]
MAVSKRRMSMGRFFGGQRFLNKGITWLQQITNASASVDYQTWQRRFLGDRLRLCIWIALLCNATFAAINFYNFVLHPNSEVIQQTIQLLGDPQLYEKLKWLLITSDWLTMLLLLVCFFIRQTSWGNRHPVILFLMMSWSMTLAPQILGTLSQFPIPASWTFIFMAQVVLVPIKWRLHLLSQLGSIGYYFGVNGVLGITEIPGMLGLFDLEAIASALWICLICDIAVFLYDRLQQREFESRRELQLFLHAVTHDLRTPVVGTSIVLQKLLQKANAADGQATIAAAKLEQMLVGSDRQLNLINSILEAHSSEQSITLACQPLQLSALIESVLADLAALLEQNQVVLTNQITAELPLIEADRNHLWRVFSNLVTNALKHNPPGITLTLNAVLQTPRLIRCTIQDNGVGIPPQQQRHLFELYYRGSQSHYIPGLGLGLYLCRQIITAHGGQI